MTSSATPPSRPAAWAAVLAAAAAASSRPSASSFADVFDDLFGDYHRVGGRGGRRRVRACARTCATTWRVSARGRLPTAKRPTVRVATSMARLRTVRRRFGQPKAIPAPATCRELPAAMARSARQQGFFTVERTCPTCQGGAGRVIENPCRACAGSPAGCKRKRPLSVNIPEPASRTAPASVSPARARPACAAARRAISISSCAFRATRCSPATATTSIARFRSR